jgi:hypothetical protein
MNKKNKQINELPGRSLFIQTRIVSWLSCNQIENSTLYFPLSIELYFSQ